MQVLSIGLSHRSAPVEVRERLHYSDSALKAALARFACGPESRPHGISELVVLSTCNRLELYARVPNPGIGLDAPPPDEALLEFLEETRDVERDVFLPHLYRHTGQVAAEHLCRVAAGLDSMVLGEPQILGQVAEAHEVALGHEAAGPILSMLFRTAIRAGKRARAETAIGRNPASVGSVAVRLAEATLGELSGASVLVLGAGEIAELAMQALRAGGARHATVVSRTHERARQLAGRWGAEALTFERLTEALASADIVITSTDAPHFIVTPDIVRASRESRAKRAQVFIDIAVPRDVDPAVSEFPDIRVYDIDDLQSRSQDGLAERAREVPRVEAIVREEVQRFDEWLRQRDVLPVIVELRSKAERIRRDELRRTLRQMPGLDPSERERIEAFSESLVRKMLHDITSRLKAEAGNGRADEYAATVRALFALDGTSHREPTETGAE